MQHAIIADVGLGNGFAECQSRMFGEFIRILGVGGQITDAFQDFRKVSDGKAFRQKVLQEPVHLSNTELSRDQFVDHRGMGFLEVVQKMLNILPGKDVGRLLLDGLR